jgi:hypothetical protein
MPGRLVIINRDRNYYILLRHIIPHILVSVKRKSARAPGVQAKHVRRLTARDASRAVGERGIG